MTSPAATASGSCMCDNASVVINCAFSSSLSDIESRNNNDEKLTNSMNCSSYVTAEMEEAVEGAMELKSVKPYKTQDEYLYAMREDLAEWFNGLYDLQMTSDTFFEALDTGIVLCQHANNVRDFMAKWLEKRRSASVPVPVAGGEDDEEKVEAAVSLQKKVTFMTRVKAGSFQARDNLVNFLTWCRFIGVPEVLLFETSDLVLRRNERNVILCLLEVCVTYRLSYDICMLIITYYYYYFYCYLHCRWRGEGCVMECPPPHSLRWRWRLTESFMKCRKMRRRSRGRNLLTS